MVYFLGVFLPVTSCSDKVAEAVHQGASAARPSNGRTAPFGAFLDQRVLPPLHDAAKEDPDDVRVPVLLAQWTGELWSICPPGDVQKLADSAVGYARKAQKLDPRGRTATTPSTAFA